LGAEEKRVLFSMANVNEKNLFLQVPLSKQGACSTKPQNMNNTPCFLPLKSPQSFAVTIQTFAKPERGLKKDGRACSLSLQ
jgi:hypothetical protein